MSTRSTIRFFNESETSPILSVYLQFDGYLDGVGAELAKWLLTKKIVSKIGTHEMSDGFAYGMGCLAAQFVAEHKLRIGSFYLTTNEDMQEYNYSVRYINNEFIIEVGYYKFTPLELLEYIKAI